MEQFRWEVLYFPTARKELEKLLDAMALGEVDGDSGRFLPLAQIPAGKWSRIAGTSPQLSWFRIRTHMGPVRLIYVERERRRIILGAVLKKNPKRKDRDVQTAELRASRVT